MSDNWKQTFVTVIATATFLLLSWIAYGMQEVRGGVKAIDARLIAIQAALEERQDALERNQAVLLERTARLAPVAKKAH